MILAESKKKAHIVEYLLFLWQIEDLVRAAGFDPIVLEKWAEDTANSEGTDPEKEKEWIISIAAEMRSQGKTEAGHVSFVSESISAAPYGTLIVKKTLNDGFKKKIWLEANLFDDGVGVSEYSLVDTGQPQTYETINIIQNRKITKLFEYDALANTTNTFSLDIKDAAGVSSPTVTATVDLSSVY